jgi:hypothetical protein
MTLEQQTPNNAMNFLLAGAISNNGPMSKAIDVYSTMNIQTTKKLTLTN